MVPSQQHGDAKALTICLPPAATHRGRLFGKIIADLIDPAK
jgi:hypothetical protein